MLALQSFSIISSLHYLFTITEKSTFNAIAITACEETVLTEWLISYKKWLHFTFFVLQFAVFDSILPIARLLFNIKIETSWTADSLKTLQKYDYDDETFMTSFLCWNFIELTDVVHWITSRQESPSFATKRNHSPASLSLQSSCS